MDGKLITGFYARGNVERPAVRLPVSGESVATNLVFDKGPGFNGAMALVHLEAVLVADPIDYEHDKCYHCGGDHHSWEPSTDHKPDCPWLAAKAFLDSLKS